MHTDRVDKVHHTKGHMVNSTLYPCGLDCQLLGPHCSACSGTKPHPRPLALGETTLCPATLPGRMGEYNSPKPPCNKWRPWQALRHTCIHQDIARWVSSGRSSGSGMRLLARLPNLLQHSGQGCNFTVSQWARLQFWHSTAGRA